MLHEEKQKGVERARVQQKGQRDGFIRHSKGYTGAGGGIYNQEEAWFPTPLIDCGCSLTRRCPRGYRPSLRLRRLTQGARVFSSRFPGASVFPGASLFLRFSWRFFCPGASLFLAILLFWLFAFPVNSRVLAISVSWRGPWFGRTSTSTQSRFLVAFGAPAPSSLMLAEHRRANAHDLRPKSWLHPPSTVVK